MLRRSPLVERYKTEITSPPDDALLQIDDFMLYLRFAWRHKARILLAFFYAFAGGWIYYEKQPIAYGSKAKVLVEQKEAITTSGYSSHESNDSQLETYVSVIKSPWFVNKAIQENGLQNLESLAGVSDCASRILSQIDVDQKNSIFEISFESTFRDECPLVLNALVQTYQRYLSESERRNMEQAIELIRRKADTLQQELLQQKLAHQHSKAAVPLSAIERAEHAATSRQLSEIDIKRIDTKVRRAEVQSRLAAISLAKLEGVQAASSLLPAIYSEQKLQLSATETHKKERMEDQIERSISRDESKRRQSYERTTEARIRIQALEEKLGERLFPLLESEKLLSRQYGDNYPALHELRKKIDLIRDFYTEQIKLVKSEMESETQAVAADAKISVASPRQRSLMKQTPAVESSGGDSDAALAELVESYVCSLEQVLKDLDAAELALAAQYQTISQRMDQHRTRVRESELYQVENDHVVSEIALAERRYDILVNQLSQFDLNKDYGNYRTTVISPPTDAKKVSPDAIMTTIASFVIGLMGAFIWVGCSEIFERSLKTTESISDLGLPILAQIPEQHRDRERLRLKPRPMLCTLDEPESVDAEAYRSLRTALDCGNHHNRNRVIGVTSPVAGDGKSTLAANLAVSIAQSGKRVLLIDTNLRAATMHRIFGVSNAVGLIRAMQTEGLYLLAAGPLPKSPADLIASPRFSRLIDWLRDRFQFVIIDTPPILLASESRVIAALSDGVLLTVRSHQSDPIETQHACDLLEIADANVLGVVVNESTCQTCRHRIFSPPRLMTTSRASAVTKNRIK